MKRRLHTKKVLAATIGIGAVSYVIACSGDTTSTATSDAGKPIDGGGDITVSSGNLMAPIDANKDDVGITSGNLMAPIDSGSDATDAADASHDANDDGG